ncbi:MAG TPA: DUF1800 domain-containing protein [Pyrinomonadaceae bacterium]|jgi:uncharacterized protein (DUF1800 family)
MTGNYRFIHKLTAFLMLFALSAPVFALVTDNNASSRRKSLTEDQKILHVLNRLGFGARPGDVERVKAMGLQKYIEQQLNPASINDTVAESKVKNLEIFNMSTAEVFAKYPNPGALLRQLEGGRRNQNQANNNQNQMPNNQAQTPNNQPADEQMTDKDRQERQAKLREYYKEYDLRPANQLLPQITANRVLRAVYSEKQLQEVMVDFWQNHFNVYSGKAAVRWYIPSYERDVIRKNALGNFKDLLIGTAQHPAMLFFLDNFQSISPNANNNNNRGTGRLQQMLQNGTLTPQMRERIKQQRGLTDEQLDQRIKQMQNQSKQKRGINENYARELMELHTLGVDGGYTQADIVEVAKCFTGWTIADPQGYRRIAANEIKGTDNKQLNRLQKLPGVPDDIDSGEFYFNERWHEPGTKTVLGQKISEGGMKDGLKVIDLLVAHPSTAKFIAKKLAVKFVSDNPSEDLVARVAKAFQDSKGDIKTTLKALFNDKEFFAPSNYRAKIKTPLELAVSAIRTIGAETNASPAILAMLNKLGEVPYGYQAPTGYPDTAEDWVNAGALLERLNFTVALASNRIPGTRADLKLFEAGTKSAVLDKTIAVVLDNDISPTTRQTLLRQIEQPLPDVKSPNEVDENPEVTNMRAGGGGQGGRMNRQARLLTPSGNPEVFKVVSLVLGTPEFQRQ